MALFLRNGCYCPIVIKDVGQTACEYVFSDILSEEECLSKGIAVTRQQAAEPIED